MAQFHPPIPIVYEHGDELLHIAPYYRCTDPTCPCQQASSRLMQDWHDSQKRQAIAKQADETPTTVLPRVSEHGTNVLPHAPREFGALIHGDTWYQVGMMGERHRRKRPFWKRLFTR